MPTGMPGGNAPGKPISKVELLPGYDQGGASDVDWLSESVQQLTLQPGTSATVTVCVLGDTATGGTAPLAGATVQIDSWATSYTLTTSADGTYGLWLDVRNNPLTVIVAKDEYQPTVTTIKLKKGATATANFTLKRK